MVSSQFVNYNTSACASRLFSFIGVCVCTYLEQIQRVGHFFDLVAINSSDIDRVILKFKEFEIDIQEPSAGTDLISIIRKAFQIITCSFAEYAVPQITLIPSER